MLSQDPKKSQAYNKAVKELKRLLDDQEDGTLDRERLEAGIDEVEKCLEAMEVQNHKVGG